jgi:hypothetical protein
MPISWQKSLTAVAAIVFVSLGTFWGLKFKRIYLDPWPQDAVNDSLFMRMTASHLKPMNISEFMRDNELSGKMFNYWTEGGAIAFGQKPDPETGEIPLKLFMDGRAQAAYNHEKFVLWSYIHAGGKTAFEIARSGRRPTKSDYIKIGREIDTLLGKYDVWVTVMPVTQLNSNFIKGITTHKDWKVTYLDDEQMMLVDTDTAKGKDLFNRVISAEAKFPNEFAKNLTLSRNLLRTNSKQLIERGFEYAGKAFEQKKTHTALIEIINAGRYNFLREKVKKILKDFIDDFLANRQEYRSQGGYMKRTIAAFYAANYYAKSFAQSPTQKKEMNELAAGLKEEYQVTMKKSTW